MSWLVGNWKLKLLAAALAVGLLAAVAFSENPPQVVSVPVSISYANLPAGLVLVAPPTSVSVRVTGLSNAVRQFRQETSGVAAVDVSRAHAGAGQTYDAHVTTPASNVSISQTTVPVTLDIEKVVTKQLKVDVAVPHVEHQYGISVVSDGTYATCGSDQHACMVTVTGPQSLLSGLAAYVSFDLPINAAGIERAPGLPVMFKDANGKPVNLRQIPTNPEIVNVSPDAVTARVQTDGGEMTKTVGLSVRAAGQPACGYRVDGVAIQPDAFADISGSIDVVSKITSIALDPVNISGASSTLAFTRDLSTSVGGATVVNPTGGEVTVTVSISQAYSCAPTVPSVPVPTPAPTPTASPSPTH